MFVFLVCTDYYRFSASCGHCNLRGFNKQYADTIVQLRPVAKGWHGVTMPRPRILSLNFF